MKEIVSSNIQLLYAQCPRPALNWFLSEREASLSTDTQPCFPHLPHPTQITPPSALPHCIVHLPHSSLLSSPLDSFSPLSCLINSSHTAIIGWHGPQLPYSTFNLSLISLHCNGKWFCVLLFDWGCGPALYHRGNLCLGVGGVFNFALAQIVFYQRIHISNLILHINRAVCKWPNRKIDKSGEKIDGTREKNENWLQLLNFKKLHWMMWQLEMSIFVIVKFKRRLKERVINTLNVAHL